jgi:hypothetical protein
MKIKNTILIFASCGLAVACFASNWFSPSAGAAPINDGGSSSVFPPTCNPKPAAIDSCQSRAFYYSDKIKSTYGLPSGVWNSNYYLKLVRETVSADTAMDPSYFSNIICPLFRMTINEDTFKRTADYSVAAKDASDCYTKKEICYLNSSSPCKEETVKGVVHANAVTIGGSSLPGGGSSSSGGPTGGSAGTTGGDAAEDSTSAEIALPTPVKIIDSACSDGDARKCLESGPASTLTRVLDVGLSVLSGAIGLVAVIMVIIGGIQYSTAGGNPTAVANAKKRIGNVVIGLMAYVYLYAFLQWLIPGGLF